MAKTFQLKFAAIIFSAAALLAVSTAKAEIENPNTLPLGDREAYLGNAGVALEGSGGNIFYNPAGLGQLKGKRISASGSAYALVKGRLALTSDRSVDFSTIQTVPNMVVSTRHYEDFTLGYGVLVPIVFEGSVKANLDFPAAGGTMKLDSTFKSEEQYIGVAAGKELTNGWAIGGGIFAHHYLHESTDDSFVNGAVIMSQHIKLRLDTISLFPLVGVQKRLNPHWLVGARVMIPDIEVYGKSQENLYQQIDAGGPPIVTVIDQEYNGNYQQPLDILVGGTWTDSRNLVTASNGTQFGASFDDMPGSDQRTHYKTKTTMRQSLGFEHIFDNGKTGSIGLMRNPSTSESVQKLTSGSLNPQTHFYAVTLGYHDPEPKFISGIGASYSVSQQKEKVFAFTPDHKNGYQIFMLIVSTNLDY